MINCFLGAIEAQLVAKAASDYAGAARQAAAFVEEDAFNATMFMTDAEQKFGAACDDARTSGHDCGWRGRGSVAPVVASTLLSRVISRPTVAMSAAMRRLAGGDLAAEIPAAGRKDEVGQIALAAFKANAREARNQQATAEKDHELKARRQPAMDHHTQDFSAAATGVMASLARSADAMRATADKKSDAAHRTRASAARAADGATTSATNFGAVSAAAEQMSSSINEISQQVGRVTQAVSEAVERANVADAKVGGMAVWRRRLTDPA